MKVAKGVQAILGCNRAELSLTLPGSCSGSSSTELSISSSARRKFNMFEFGSKARIDFIEYTGLGLNLYCLFFFI